MGADFESPQGLLNTQGHDAQRLSSHVKIVPELISGPFCLNIQTT